MPELQIAHDMPESMVVPILVGTMLFPNDKETAYEYFVKEWLLQDRQLNEAQNDEVVNLPASMVKALIAGPSLKELEAQKAIRLRMGYTAGCVLLSLRLCSELGTPLSLNRAVRVIERAKLADNATIQNVSLYSDKPKILESWAAMGSVAHLFAAFAVVSAQVENQEVRPEDGTIDSILTLAVTLLEWASSARFEPKSGGGVVLDAETAWKLPERYKPIELGQVSRERLPPWFITAIEHYRYSQ